MSYWLSTFRRGATSWPKENPRADTAVVGLLNLPDGWARHFSVDNLWLPKTVLISLYRIGFIGMFVEYKQEATKQAINQIVMDLMAAARFASYLGLKGLTIWGFLITAREYQVYTVDTVS